MVNRVHSGAANRRTYTHPARPPGFADDDEIIFFVADRADRSVAEVGDFTNLGGGKLHLRVAGIMRDHLGEVARRANENRAGAGRKFYVVYKRTDRNFAERHSVARGKRHVLADDK